MFDLLPNQHSRRVAQAIRQEEINRGEQLRPLHRIKVNIDGFSADVQSMEIVGWGDPSDQSRKRSDLGFDLSEVFSGGLDAFGHRHRDQTLTNFCIGSIVSGPALTLRAFDNEFVAEPLGILGTFLQCLIDPIAAHRVIFPPIPGWAVGGGNPEMKRLSAEQLSHCFYFRFGRREILTIRKI